ncbi:phage major capsid protein, P2 family [Mannheimia pernigra]|uniref:phage major capsid protein, P2 family n=1 Tax=Mannheimia pernigra TaxID=111844 RepID=UPI00159F552A|nr:phage major capsid protein, P2 family [Mannheimia pernigra]QLB44723.1 phage major capsid protein, P2 family [Mannheimia pernigra]
MEQITTEALNTYTQGVADDNGVAFNHIYTGKQFNVQPTVQQKLEKQVQLSSAFLGMINIVPVTEQSGQTLGLGIANTIASVTDTSKNPRKPQDLHSLTAQSYLCQQINYDSYIRYATLDMWAKFPDFQKKLGTLKAERMALDRIMIGFNGASRAKDSNRTTNPLLQDVAKGWLAKIEEHAPQRVMKEEVKSSNKIEVGGLKEDGKPKTYQTLDALVFSAVSDLIEPQFQDDTQLVAIMSRDLQADYYFPLLNESKATEKLAGDTIISQKRCGGLRVVQVPYLPKGTILITRLDNLSIYYQTGAMRRTFKDNTEYDRYEDFVSSNDDFVVENYDQVALLKNVVITAAPVKAED